MSITYQAKTLNRSSSTGAEVPGYANLLTLRAKRYDRDPQESEVSFKETEVQYVYFLHRYRDSLKGDMQIVDGDGVVYVVEGWRHMITKRYVLVKCLKIDQDVRL